MYKTLTLACILGLATIGCSKTTPVKEISIEQSGIAVEDISPSEVDLAWPQWRGGTGGLADESSVPTTWTDQTNVRWKADVPGRGHSSPIVVGDLIVLGSATEEPPQQLVVAYDRASGQEKWRTVIHSEGFPSKRSVHQKATQANSTLASDGTHFVTAHLNGDHIWVTALGSGGELLWQTDIGAFSSKFGYAPSPVIYKSLVIVAADNQGGGYLVGLDIRTGDIGWRRSRGAVSSYSSPALVTLDGSDQLVITGLEKMASYNPATGDLIWETECISEATCGTVVSDGTHVFASGGYPDSETVCIDATGNRVWENRTKVYEPSLITDGENLFGITDGGVAYCWDAANGTEHWKKRLGGNFSSSPVICFGNIYVSDLSGNAFVFKASKDSYELVSKNKLGNDCYASPAIAGDAIFYRVGIGSGEERVEKLYCIAAASTDEP
ncbi:outer membrane protein assembly factor BamB family protein [Rubripirellula reticaptiva]|uniref:Outer membrane biogenesis protein BamB n=1 Tax=Rubripirellula reticaptiva TaxID=2528013 RepID=A0A5C6F6D6_9BACT|nr:PQQ-binding-like beta-propeller repeat protein [Rubripirellula reticaptiva]TWU55636.1 outer membrane biogenesis protein BamB [Rubripirellula reticaptiva]